MMCSVDSQLPTEVSVTSSGEMQGLLQYGHGVVHLLSPSSYPYVYMIVHNSELILTCQICFMIPQKYTSDNALPSHKIGTACLLHLTALVTPCPRPFYTLLLVPCAFFVWATDILLG